MDNAFAYLIPIVAIAGGITYAIFDRYYKAKRDIATAGASPEVAAALRTSNELNATLVGKLTAIETRLSAIEKTLNEVG
jgi:hypothetical protein